MNLEFNMEDKTYFNTLNKLIKKTHLDQKMSGMVETVPTVPGATPLQHER